MSEDKKKKPIKKKTPRKPSRKPSRKRPVPILTFPDGCPRAAPWEIILSIIEEDGISPYALSVRCDFGNDTAIYKMTNPDNPVNVTFATLERILVETGRDWDYVLRYNARKRRLWQEMKDEEKKK